MRRRDLLALPATLPFVIAGRAFAVDPGQPRLLIVFLRGGYDAANVLIPTSADLYYQARPSLQIARPDPDNPLAALPLDADWSLHPALKQTLLPMWEHKEIAFVPFAGTDDLTRSHFETQDSIELGQPVQGARDYASGFMSRLTSVLGGGRGISFTDQLPLAFRGGPVIPNIALTSVGKPGVDDRQAGLIRQMYAGTPLAASVDKGFQVRDEVYAQVSAEMAAASRGAVSPQGFELAARRIGRLMRADYNLGFVDIGGWDTHVNQGAATGYLPDRLRELSRGLVGLREELGDDAWRESVVVVLSEFGRTFHENGNKGTDHGHGSAYWVLGGAVKGGRIAGEQVKLVASALNQNRDWPVLTDYRALVGGLAARLYGLDPSRLAHVFPQAPAADLGLV